VIDHCRRYTFPSHFFLPSGSELAFVEDGFGGLLPQPFVQTWATPPQPMNDRNEEEQLRYVPFATCDFFVMSNPLERQQTEVIDGAVSQEAVMTGHISPLLAFTRSSSVSSVHCESLIDAQRSQSALARAFSIPFFSPPRNYFVDYCLYKNNNRV
jgi:hypothetical protein